MIAWPTPASSRTAATSSTTWSTVMASGGRSAPRVVVPRHPDTAVFDHDDVQALGGGPTPQPAIWLHRRHSRPAGEDDERMCRLAAATHVIEVELLVAAGRHRSAHRADTGQRGQLVVRPATLGVHGHRRSFCPPKGEAMAMLSSALQCGTVDDPDGQPQSRGKVHLEVFFERATQMFEVSGRFVDDRGIRVRVRSRRGHVEANR